MSLARLMVHDVTIVRATYTTDPRGDPEPEWGTGATRRTVKGWVSQRGTTEVAVNREALLSSWVAYLPAGTDVTGRDRLEWRGTTFLIAGVPNHADTPRGPHHVEVPLTVVEG